MDYEKILSVSMPFIKAGLILLVGHIIIVYIVKLIKRGFWKSSMDESLAKFLAKAINITLHSLICLSAISSLGISTTGLVAALSAGVVAVGVALKDSLGNIAGGILLLISPRFVTGDYIETENDGGTVISVDLLHTTIRTPDNKQVSIPNGVLINSHITNYSREQNRRVDITVPIPYEADIEAAKQIIKQTVSKHSLILVGFEEPLVRVSGYGDSAVNVIARGWCKTADYWTVYFDLTEQIRANLKEHGMDIPYNKLDITVNKAE